MGVEILLSVLVIASYHLQYGNGQKTLYIKDFISDSNSMNEDRSQAFQDAWKALCGGKGSSLVIQASESYTLQPQFFQGPCVPPNIRIQIDGTIESPKKISEWGGKNIEYWLSFSKVNGLVLTGTGLLNLHGENWWSSSVAISSRPGAVKFSGCQNLVYNGLTIRNSPKNHIEMYGCTNATLSNLHIYAPENSPNTDGIDIMLSHDIHILGTTIGTGDDCIAIKGGSSNINITDVACGPGHGISVGSLGKGGANDVVQNVNVRHCSFKGTQNCARIKTWAGGRGFARNIVYEDITLTNAKFPIIIDQHYNNDAHPIPLAQATAVKVSGVTFRSFRGTCAGGYAIKLDCDNRLGCDNIVMEHFNVTSSSRQKPLTVFCQFAHVLSSFVSIAIKCNFDRNSLSPAPQPRPSLFFPFL